MLDTTTQTAARWLIACIVLLLTGVAGAQTDTAPRPMLDSRLIFVSPDGDDQNDGLTPDDAVQTVERGLGLLRAESPDWLLLERGRSFTLSSTALDTLGTLEQPVVITAWGEGTNPRLFLEDQPRTSLLSETAAGTARVYDVVVMPAGGNAPDGPNAGGAPSAIFYTHHLDIQAAYPGALRPLIVLTQNDLNYTRHGPPPSDAAIDEAFEPGNRAYKQVMLAIEQNAMIVDDGEWMPAHHPTIDYAEWDRAIQAKLRVVAHVRRLAPDLPIAIFGPISDPYSWVGLTRAAEGQPEWVRRVNNDLGRRIANWDEAWAYCIEHLLPAYDAVAAETYPKIRHADFYPLEPDERWQPNEWLPRHIEEMKLAGLPVIPFVWHRYNSAHPDPNRVDNFPIADRAYTRELIEVLNDQDIEQAILWMSVDETLDDVTKDRIDLILETLDGP